MSDQTEKLFFITTIPMWSIVPVHNRCAVKTGSEAEAIDAGRELVESFITQQSKDGVVYELSAFKSTCVQQEIEIKFNMKTVE